MRPRHETFGPESPTTDGRDGLDSTRVKAQAEASTPATLNPSTPLASNVDKLKVKDEIESTNSDREPHEDRICKDFETVRACRAVEIEVFLLPTCAVIYPTNNFANAVLTIHHIRPGCSFRPGIEPEPLSRPKDTNGRLPCPNRQARHPRRGGGVGMPIW